MKTEDKTPLMMEGQKNSQEWQEVYLRTPSGMEMFVKMPRERISRIKQYLTEHPNATEWEAAMETK